MLTSYPLRRNGNEQWKRISVIIHHLVMIICICSNTFIIPLSVIEARGSIPTLNEVFDEHNSSRQNGRIKTTHNLSNIKSSSVKNHWRHAQTDNGQVIGGTLVPPGKYPFFAQLPCCGATLIHHDIVLTAAHCGCVVANETIVLLNITNRSTGDPHLVERVIQFPAYNPSTELNDIQIFKLSCSSKVKPIALNFQRNLPVAGSDVTVIGTGMREIFEYPDDVYETTVEVVTNRVCSTIMKKAFNGTLAPINGTAMLCAIGDGRDTCFGDSGGPIFLPKSNGNHVQVGITSFGVGCAYKDFPGVYTRVSTYRQFILDFIKQYSSPVPKYC